MLLTVKYVIAGRFLNEVVPQGDESYAKVCRRIFWNILVSIGWLW